MFTLKLDALFSEDLLKTERDCLARHGSWADNAVLKRNLLDFIWDLSDVFMVHICSGRAQIQSVKSS